MGSRDYRTSLLLSSLYPPLSTSFARAINGHPPIPTALHCPPASRAPPPIPTALTGRSRASRPASTASTSTPSATSTPRVAPRLAGTTTPSTARTQHQTLPSVTSVTSATLRLGPTVLPSSTSPTRSSPSVAVALFSAAVLLCTTARTTSASAASPTRRPPATPATALPAVSCEFAAMSLDTGVVGGVGSYALGVHSCVATAYEKTLDLKPQNHGADIQLHCRRHCRQVEVEI